MSYQQLRSWLNGGLSFRGNNSEFGSVHNGNYMGCLEPIAHFDPFLCEHIAKYGNKGRGNVSYQ